MSQICHCILLFVHLKRVDFHGGTEYFFSREEGGTSDKTSVLDDNIKYLFLNNNIFEGKRSIWWMGMETSEVSEMGTIIIN